MNKNYHKEKRKRIIFIISTLLISSLSLYYIIYLFKDNLHLFYSITDFYEKYLKDEGKRNNIIRIGGMVKEDSININDNIIKFTITDYNYDIDIKYKGMAPNMFREKQGIVATGIYNKEKKLFIASQLLTKHDENYMPPEVRYLQDSK